MTASNGQRNGVHQGRPTGQASRGPAPRLLEQHETLDRLLELDLAHYAKRRQRDPQSSYLAGESGRMNPVPYGIDPLGSDADYHYRTERNYFLMVERARAAVRNHPLVEQGVNRLIANLRLTQIQLDANTGDRNLDRYLRDKWNAWKADKMACDWEQARDFDSLVAQSFFNQVVDGDVLHIPLGTGQLQTWESHHIRNPFGHIQTGQDQDGIVHGAKVEAGRTVGWFVTPFALHYGASVSRRTATRYYPQFDSDGNQVAFYGSFAHRFGQRRGVSRLSAPRDAMNGFDDLNYAHIKSALRRSLISYLMKNNQPLGQPGLDGGQLPQAGDRYTEQMGLGLESVIVEQQGEPAQVFKAPEGYDIDGWNANLPGSSYFEQAALMLTMLAVNLDLPLMMFLLDGSLVNFHGGRMTWDQVKLRLQELQRGVILSRHWPVYQWQLRRWITPGSDALDPVLAAAAEAGENLLAVKFRPRGWPYVKPMEDVAAEDMAESRNLKSRRAIMAERGDDLDEVDDEILDDRLAMIQKSIDRGRRLADMNTDLEIDILAYAAEIRHGWGSPTGVQLTLAAGEDEPAKATTTNGGGNGPPDR